MTPDGWTRRSLTDLAESVVQQVQPGPDDDRPYVALEHLAKGEPRLLGWSRAGIAESTKAIFRQGDVLFGKLRPNLKKAAIAPFDGVCSTDILVLRPSREVDPRYLLSVCHWPPLQGYAVSTASGTKMPRTSWPLLAPFEFDVPPLPEQQKIAAILSSVDDAIESTQAVIDQLGVVKKAMMAELLTRGLPGRHTRFKQTELGEVPEGWEVGVLSDHAVVQTGLAKGKAVEDGTELPYLRVANVQDGHVDLAELKTIAVESRSVERYRLRAGDVLFTEGGDADKLGRGCVWNGQVDPCLHQNHVFSVRPDPASLAPDFLAAWAASDGGKAYFLGCAKQTTNLASINSTQLKALPIPLPSLEEQREIVACLGSVGDRISGERAGLAGLRTARSALMSALLTGGVRVRLDEDAA